MTEKTEETKKEIPFYPDHVTTEFRVAMWTLGIIVIIGIIGIFSPVGLGDPADPMNTPAHVKPEWYFLGLYQILKFVPKTVGVIIPIIGVIALFIFPFFSKAEDSKKRMKIRAIGSAIFVVLFILITIWGEVS